MPAAHADPASGAAVPEQPAARTVLDCAHLVRKFGDRTVRPRRAPGGR
ncbi:hypothetical protein [Streptomyces sp. PvR034]